MTSTLRQAQGERYVPILTNGHDLHTKSFNETNLWYMRQFYLTFPIPHALRGESEFTILATGIRPELSWTHYRLLLKVKEKHVRDFYIKETLENNWSTRQLERQINSFYYERILSSQNKALVRAEANTNEPVLSTWTKLLLYSDKTVRGELVEPYTTLRQAQGERGKCIINFVQVLKTTQSND